MRESENDDENDDDKIEDDYQNEVDENIVKDENLYDSDSLIENEIDAGQNERPITILGIVKSYEGDDMKNPGIRIAVRFENRSEIHIVPSAVLRKLCPYQLSKFYEQCITFDEDEACTIHPIT
ncbi:hypothetical protein TRFO_14601 [Tritrichomonas foetus]|uniref:Chromo shadow domain-containing protein n=1 Tax=Tritrichomonas foetus TaxID=1144522 RepID=A0A1J4KUK6_9EUKA|nr:hypothetical protein TRFO_14601 [Tritrichomonas foetus]|eukprot:OHT14951.1 hypothetical protein TRFO_14601 [Tritrichomonas foetus]